MTIEINKPELEALIQERLQSGAFRNVEDVLMHALNADVTGLKPPSAIENKTLVQLFAESPFKGMSLDFERFPDTWPPTAP